MTIMSEPQFPPDTELILSQLALDLPDTTVAWSLTQAELENSGLAKPFAELFMDMKHMIHDFVTIWPQKPHPTYCSHLLQRMLYLPSPKDSSSLEFGTSESCRFAVALQFFWPFQQEYPNPKLRTNVGIHKLKASLEVMIPYSNADQNLMAWLLFIGGAFAEEPERNWFVSELVAVAENLKILSWEEMHKILERYIWVDGFCEPQTRGFWEEVVYSRIRLNGY
jgi:hypothetical protein